MRSHMKHLRSLTLTALVSLGGATAAHAVEAPALADLEAGQYSLSITGPVRAQVVKLTVDGADIQLGDRAMLKGEGDEKAIYTQDPIAKSTDAEGPYQVKMVLAGDYVDAPDIEDPLVAISLHMEGNLEPGEYSIDEAYFSVGPGAVPVAAMAMVISADRSTRMMFARDVSGSLELERFDRDSASGRFDFTISSKDASQPLEVKGAFKGIPWSPGDH